jgi:hypothetical protein
MWHLSGRACWNRVSPMRSLPGKCGPRSINPAVGIQPARKDSPIHVTGTMWRRSCLSAAMPTDWRWNSGGGMRRIPQRAEPSFVSGPTTRTQGTRIDPTRPYYHRCVLSNGTNSSRKLSCHIQHTAAFMTCCGSKIQLVQRMHLVRREVCFGMFLLGIGLRTFWSSYPHLGGNIDHAIIPLERNTDFRNKNDLAWIISAFLDGSFHCLLAPADQRGWVSSPQWSREAKCHVGDALRPTMLLSWGAERHAGACLSREWGFVPTQHQK